MRYKAVKLKKRFSLLNRPLFYLLIILAIGLSAFGQNALSFMSPGIPAGQNPVNKGESIEYKVSFGFFTVGKAQIQTSPKVFKINDRPCYKIDIKGQTSGAVDWVAKVDDEWGTYMDTLSFLPQRSYRNIKENNYRKNEVTSFDHRNLVAELMVLDKKTGKFRDPKTISIRQPARDLVSGYSYLRTIDYNRRAVGDTIALYGLFEDEAYDFKVLYTGKEVLKTKLGKVRAIRLVPVMPENKLFSGENAITIWLSDDANKIPLKIEASMFIGKAGCEITSYSCLKKELQFL